ncbi:MAG: TIR domain-containing protein [Sphaerochaetaceae bacterium]|nr:TIR domain-containing protein [Sphaerochaetaceae bacterium]MDD3162953.1 TIR domain-containing protein [Sphaerochaetaceae bacterium]
MPVIKCKMCGGDVKISDDLEFATCEYCGSTMTLPKKSDEKILNLFNRANHYRLQNDFDKASCIYESILAEDSSEPEAYWGLVLCRYGIEYVEDPSSKERIPTCHRLHESSILNDSDFKQALAFSTAATHSLYEKEACRISQIQKEILAISKKEKPFDVFISYKENDSSGSRTKDSVDANEIYYQLSDAGFRVFFSRISLEDKLGQSYEPYIFAALNSAKVMILIGSKPEYINAPWVKNEWKRYLELMKNDRSKFIIPCYRDMDPYLFPDELAGLQAQDMSKIGFIQDLIRGVRKIVQAKNDEAAPKNTPPVLKRAALFIQTGDFEKASQKIDQILDSNPECSEAYYLSWLIENRCCSIEELEQVEDSDAFDSDNWRLAMQFASDSEKQKYKAVEDAIHQNEQYEKSLPEMIAKLKDESVEIQNMEAEEARKKQKEIQDQFDEADRKANEERSRRMEIKVEENRKKAAKRRNVILIGLLSLAIIALGLFFLLRQK